VDGRGAYNYNNSSPYRGPFVVEASPQATVAGNNSEGQFGNGNTTSTNVDTIINLNTGRKVTYGQDSISFTTGDNFGAKLWSSGSNAYGQLGDGTTTDRSTPVQIGSEETWYDVAKGDFFTVATKTDGTLWAWGQVPQWSSCSSPVQVGTDTDWEVVWAGSDFVLAMKDNSANYWLWGNNTYGQLGDGTTVHRSSPVQVILPGTAYPSSVVYPSVGRHHVVAGFLGDVRAGIREYYTWGKNDYGQLGDGTTVNKSSPVAVNTAIKYNTEWQGFYNENFACGDHTIFKQRFIRI
jgi:alpha-tubulin suppressor-like RCC1 family protein